MQTAVKLSTHFWLVALPEITHVAFSWIYILVERKHSSHWNEMIALWNTQLRLQAAILYSCHYVQFPSWWFTCKRPYLLCFFLRSVCMSQLCHLLFEKIWQTAFSLCQNNVEQKHCILTAVFDVYVHIREKGECCKTRANFYLFIFLSFLLKCQLKYRAGCRVQEQPEGTALSLGSSSVIESKYSIFFNMTLRCTASFISPPAFLVHHLVWSYRLIQEESSQINHLKTT